MLRIVFTDRDLAAVRMATAPDPPADRIFRNVYAETNPLLEREREEYAAYLAGFEGGAH
ncbi:hypothetical protein ACFQ1S_03165 [Kibdelosporangium lantanae]|uniref:GNAT family N-acetyltransferase n=1 Tax=Kibdelosporangium lantanae TaxID=1497396 RepID=A0ABW3M1V6_9PSEU